MSALSRFPILRQLHEELCRLAVESAARDAAVRSMNPKEWSRVVSIPWVGQFVLSPDQHAVVAMLLDAMTSSQNPEMEERVLLAQAGSKCRHLEEVFEGSDAWGVLVMRGSQPWKYRLAPLPEEEDERVEKV